MRKIKKINGFLVVKFNDREKREYEGTALGEYGVIDAEVYTGNLDIDRGAMEYDDADTLEVAVELARGLESEEDITDEPPTYTAAVETNESYTEETVEPAALIEGWTRRLATQVKSKHYPDTDPRTAAHELYTRATWPNGNMNDARVHYYVDDINAWQNLREDEVGWHAGDGRKATGGNETTLSIEIIMDGTGSKEDRKAEENGVLLAALLLKKHGLSVNELYTHNHWMGHPDSIVQGARKNCPLYILPHWAQFKQKVAAKLTELNGGATTTEAGKTEIMGKAKASAQQMALFARSKNAEPQLPACSLEQLAQFFLEEGEAEGVRGDVAFAQSLHETGFFKYGGIVLPTQNNYAGIRALNGNAKGQAATFPDPRTGVRAQIQHLKAYASKETLVNGCVDPRFSLVTRGSAQYVEWLGASDNPNGKGWAVPGKGYGGKIVALLGQIMAFEVPQPSAPSEPEEQEPEFPAYQLEGLETLTEAGVINSPEFWRQKFSEQVTVGEMFGILGKLFTKVTE